MFLWDPTACGQVEREKVRDHVGSFYKIQKGNEGLEGNTRVGMK